MFDITVREFLIHLTSDISMISLWDSDHEESLFEGNIAEVKQSGFAERKVDTFAIGTRKVAGAPSSVYERIMGSMKEVPKLDIKLK